MNTAANISFKKPLIISVSIIVVALIAAGVGVYFISGDLANQAAKLASDRSAVSSEAGLVAQVSALKAQGPQARIYEAAIEQLLPTQDGLIGFTGWIAKVASANQVSATVNFSADITPPNGTTAGRAGFSMSVSGSAANIAAFLSDIETKSSGYFVQLSSFDLVENGSNYQLTAQGATFFKSS